MVEAFEFDPINPLSRAPGETTRANAALQDYYLMGPGRSLRLLLRQYQEQSSNKDATEKPPTTQFRILADWSAGYKWQERISTQAEIDNEKTRLQWEERRAAIRETDWSQALALREVAAKILAASTDFIKRRERIIKGSPKVVDAQTGQVLDPGEPERVVITLAIDLATAIRAAQTGSQLARLAAGLETDRTTQDVNVKGSITATPGVNPHDMDDEQLQRVLLSFANVTASFSASIPGGPESGGGGAPETAQGGGEAQS